MKHLPFLVILWAGLLGAARPVAAQTAPPPAKYQGKLATDPTQYILDVQAMMTSTNNAAARASGAQLQQLWGSNSLTATQQKRIIALSQTMLTKRLRPKPQFEGLFNALVAAKTTAKLSDAQTDQYLDVLTQLLDKEAPAEMGKFVDLTTRYFNGGVLYRSNHNSLRATGGTVSFAYSAIAAPVSNLEFGVPEPTPAAADEIPDAPKPGPKAPAKKTAPKPTAKKKSDGWDSADLWSSPTGGSWGNDDGWGAPVKKKAPAKTAAKTGAKTAAGAAKPAPAKAPEPAANPADFGTDTGFGAADTGAPSYDAYYPPPTRGGVLVLKDADLLISAVGDSIVLHKVSGTVVPAANRLVATGAQVAWTVKQNPVSAELGPFDFDLSKPEFTAQPVTLTYAAVLEAPAKGALSYKAVTKRPGAADTGWPRFISLTNDVRVKNLGDNITYRGGFSLAGSRMLSAALDGSASVIRVSLDGKPKFRAASPAYVLGDSLITAGRAAVAIYEGAKDSLYHPGVALKYEKANKMLKLARETGLFKDAPYIDTFHQLDIRTELVSWDLRKPNVDFSIVTGKSEQAANFESRDFFSNDRYQQLKGINRLHPLQMVVGYAQTHGNVKTVNVLDLAEAAGTSAANIRSAMTGLARDGYVSWNGQTGDVTILRKGFLYVSANRDKSDYDHIAIKSVAGNGKNATLNLNTNELLVRGVRQFNFSNDTSTVFVRPDSSQIRIGKNRDIDFSGTVVAANMRFKGKAFKFDYDKFYVDMNKIDSIVVRSQAKKANASGRRKTTDFAMTSKGASGSSGRLYLNDPKNKSGRKRKLNYPSFDSKSNTNVYFGKEDVLGGAYDSTLVFDIPPFKLDSLNGSSKTKGGFDGTFRSGGIIPDIKTKLVSQPDGSLGFEYPVPAEGFPLYKGKGRVTGKVLLNSKGLQSSGTVKYEAGTFTSDDFVMYKDSLVAVGKTGVVAARTTAKANSPKLVMPDGYLLRWAVKTDTVFMTSPPEGAPIKLYQPVAGANGKTPAGGYNFEGTALLTPTGTGGRGRLDGPQSFIKSPDMQFKSDSYSGKKAVFNIKSAEVGKPALTATDVAFNYDLTKGSADFTREAGSNAAMELPYAQFKTTLSGGHWDFKKKRVDLKRAAGADSTRSYFYSTNPDQFGLKFRAATGVYDLAKYRLETGGVPYVASADAWIIPDSGRVSVLAKGELKPFKNAGVQMDSLAKFHQLKQGNIRVLSKRAFAGDAIYTFKTLTNSYDIKFTNFEVDSAGLKTAKRKPRKAVADESGQGAPTVAVGVVDAKTVFQLAPRMAYRGDIKINSQHRGLLFDGQVQLRFGGSKSAGEWFALRDTVDPKNVAITIREPKAEDGTALLTGLFMSDATNKVYPLYVAGKHDPTDVPIFTVDGKLKFDERRELFTLSRVDADDPNVYQGAALTYGNKTERLTFRGPMTFISSNKNFSQMGVGIGEANPDSAEYRINTLLGFNILMPAKAVDVMAADLKKLTEHSVEALNGSGPGELYKLGEYLGDKGVEAYATRKGNDAVSLPNLSSKLAGHTILLSQVDLKWSEKHKAWYSVGQLGLAGVGKQSMNALIDGYVEIKRENSIDFVDIYLEPEPGSFYFLHYANNVLLTKSSNEAYDLQVGSKVKGDASTATAYGAFLGQFEDVEQFRAHFRKDYLGKSGKIEPRPAPKPADTTPDEPGTDPGAKKKKKDKQDDAFGTDGAAAAPTEPPTDAPTDEPTADNSKKKKKGKDKKADANDPFAADEPAPAPAPAKAKAPAPTPAAPAPAAATPAAAPPATAPVATPTPAPATPAATAPAPEPTPATAPAAAPTPDPAIAQKEADRLAKEAAQAAAQAAKEAEKAAALAAKEAEKAAKEAEKQKKEEEKRKAAEEKKKKADENDPFGGS